MNATNLYKFHTRNYTNQKCPYCESGILHYSITEVSVLVQCKYCIRKWFYRRVESIS